MSLSPLGGRDHNHGFGTFEESDLLSLVQSIIAWFQPLRILQPPSTAGEQHVPESC